MRQDNVMHGRTRTPILKISFARTADVLCLTANLNEWATLLYSFKYHSRKCVSGYKQHTNSSDAWLPHSRFVCLILHYIQLPYKLHDTSRYSLSVAVEHQQQYVRDQPKSLKTFNYAQNYADSTQAACISRAHDYGRHTADILSFTKMKRVSSSNITINKHFHGIFGNPAITY